MRDDNLSIDKSAFSDIEEAIHSLTQTRHMREYILVGHCSGAIHSFMSANKDNRIVGAVIINPEGDDQGWGEYDRKRKLARYYQNYYSKEAFTDRSRWVKLLTGKASYRSILRNLFQNILWNRISGVIFRFKKQQEPTGEKAPETNPIQLESLESLRSLSKKDKPLLFVYTEGGTGLERFRLLLKNELDGLDTAPIFSMQTISGSDHLFTPRPAQDNLIQTIKSWIEEKFVSAYVSDSI